MANALDIVEAVRRNKTATVGDIRDAIEEFAPRSLQESYDNSGLQVGNPDEPVSAVMICLDFTEEILEEAITKGCNLIVSHHPLLFKGLKEITGSNSIQRIVIKAIRNNIALYSAHTNLDSAWNGVSHEMARMLGLNKIDVLEPNNTDKSVGLGIIGEIKTTPTLEFLRKVKDIFSVKSLRFSTATSRLTIRQVALCSGSGATLIPQAINRGADAIITGDVKYHDFTSFAEDILIADIGHYESELCSRNILSRIISEHFPNLPIYFPKKEKNPVGIL